MQLKYLFLQLFLGCGLILMAQNENDSVDVHLEDITINFITTYYEQDGNHSPVTGGMGTEKLNNIAPAIIVNVPIDSINSLSFNGGVDFYSSASSDNINNPFLDPNHVSGASASDARFYLTTGYKRKNIQKHSEKGVYFGYSSEFDVLSFSGGFIARCSKNFLIAPTDGL